MDSRVMKSRNERSLCEKSMSVMVNVIRLSSFSIAQRTLGVGKAAGNKMNQLNSGSDYSSDMGPEYYQKEPAALVNNNNPDHHQFPAAAAAGSRRSQQPQSRANPTYVIKSVGSNNTDGSTSTAYVIQKDQQCVDGLASDYINKIRNKLGHGS